MLFSLETEQLGNFFLAMICIQKLDRPRREHNINADVHASRSDRHTCRSFFDQAGVGQTLEGSFGCIEADFCE